MIHGWRALDAGDWDNSIACWMPHAVLEFGPWREVGGRDAILRTVREAESGYATMRHLVLTRVFDVRGTRRTVTSALPRTNVGTLPAHRWG
jgi:hypothetical protein